MGTSSGHASCVTSVPGAASTIASGYAPDSTVPAVAMTATAAVLVAAAAATAPGRTTPTTGTVERARTRPSARAVAVLQASTSSLTSCCRSQSTASSVNRRTSPAGRGPYGARPLSPR